MNVIILLTGTVCLYLLLYHTGWILLAGGILAVGYLLRQHDLAAAVPKDRDPNLSRQEFYSDLEEKAEKAAELKMKPNYKADPEWQRLSKKLQRQVYETEKKEENEARLEELTNEVI